MHFPIWVAQPVQTWTGPLGMGGRICRKPPDEEFLEPQSRSRLVLPRRDFRVVPARNGDVVFQLWFSQS